MICPLCGREHDGKYNIKIQQVNADGSKTNFVNSRICYRCTDYLVGRFANFTNGTQLGKNAILRAESEKSDRVESMCCDCLQEDRHSICGDYSENELCKHRKEDGSCWK